MSFFVSQHLALSLSRLAAVSVGSSFHVNEQAANKKKKKKHGMSVWRFSHTISLNREREWKGQDVTMGRGNEA